ncbi:MAG: ribonuclease III [Rhodospirillales bacterium]|nr:ribonuclease III [Rhodospirillales bacterium]
MSVSEPQSGLIAVESLLGHVFVNRDLLRAALTHASADGADNYERLEFLGDRVLGLAVADLLYETFPDEVEGPLAKRLAALVQRSVLADIAAKMDLGESIALSAAERAAGGRENENILADTLEALLGALYRDAGYPACAALVRRLWEDRVRADVAPPEDPKTALQEWTQGRGLGLPIYTLAGRAGPDHAPVFTIQVDVSGYAPVQGSGSSRSRAEKAAAGNLLKILRGEGG